MVGTAVVAANPPGPSAQMAIAEAAGPCPEDTAFCRERNPPRLTRGDNGLTFKKKKEKVPTKQKRVGFCHRTHSRAARRQLLLREEEPRVEARLLVVELCRSIAHAGAACASCDSGAARTHPSS